MGADYEGQETPITFIRGLPDEVKACLSHHLRNCLAGILGGAQIGRPDLVEDAARHMVEDLKNFGL